MTGFTNKEVLSIVESFQGRMDTGFTDIHKKITECNRVWYDKFDEHEDKITEINTHLEVKKAVNNVKREDAKEKKDIWKWVIRATIMTTIPALLVTLWKLMLIANKLGVE